LLTVFAVIYPAPESSLALNYHYTNIK